jgi:hypothetical protein
MSNTIESFLNESTVVWNKVQDHDVYYHVFQFDGDTFVLVKQKGFHCYNYRLILIKNFKSKLYKDLPLTYHYVRTRFTEKQILECDDRELLIDLTTPYNIRRWVTDSTDRLKSRSYFEVETKGTYKFYADGVALIEVTI